MKYIKDIIWRIYDTLFIKVRYKLLWFYNKRFTGQERFKDIHTFCLFIGYPRSGHSLIGALLDAHPNMAISFELDVCRLIDEGYTKEQIYSLILLNSKFNASLGRKGNGYNQSVKNSWQGKYKKLQIIGDKKGGRTAIWLAKQPDIMKTLKSNFPDMEIKFIHCIRNPYDNISTMVIRSGKNLDDRIHLYGKMLQNIENLMKRISVNNIMAIRLEDFIKNPKENLRNICKFLNTSAPDDYLNMCASIVWDKPKKSRYQIDWPEDKIKQLKNSINKFSFLKNYEY